MLFSTCIIFLLLQTQWLKTTEIYYRHFKYLAWYDWSRQAKIKVSVGSVVFIWAWSLFHTQRLLAAFISSWLPDSGCPFSFSLLAGNHVQFSPMGPQHTVHSWKNPGQWEHVSLTSFSVTSWRRIFYLVRPMWVISLF